MPANTLTEAQIQDFRNIFDLLDLDKGGSISCKELRHLLGSLGMKVTKEEVLAMIASVDEDKSGEIDFDEFLKIICCDINEDYTQEEVLESFKIFAGDAPDGFIHISSLEQALRLYGRHKLTPEQADDILSQIEVPGEFFNYKHHVHIMMD